jgi:DNA polymerase (family 10)
VQDQFALPPEKQTARLLRALDAKRVSILAHPLGRLFPGRAAMTFDVERVIAAAKARRCVLELNARPERLDLPDTWCRAAKSAGVRIAIGSDAKGAAEFDHLRWGLVTARRGWLEPRDVLNTLGAAEVKAALKGTMG